MKTFMDQDFLLQNNMASSLFHNYFMDAQNNLKSHVYQMTINNSLYFLFKHCALQNVKRIGYGALKDVEKGAR